MILHQAGEGGIAAAFGLGPTGAVLLDSQLLASSLREPCGFSSRCTGNIPLQKRVFVGIK
jgi:hypothetical protein